MTKTNAQWIAVLMEGVFFRRLTPLAATAPLKGPVLALLNAMTARLARWIVAIAKPGSVRTFQAPALMVSAVRLVIILRVWMVIPVTLIFA